MIGDGPSPTSGRQATSRIPALDGLRGAAALVVLLHHSLLTLDYFTDEKRGINATPLHVFWAGREAVYIFFVLSGFVLIGPALKRGVQAHSYYPSRLLRLYLPVLSAVALGFLVTVLVPRTPAPGQSSWMRLHQFEVTPWTFLRDGFLLAGTTDLNTPLWSLQWEVVFSLLLPLYVAAARHFRRHWLLVVLASAIASTVGTGLDAEPLRYLPMFLIGGMLATQLSRFLRPVSKARSSLWGIVFLASLVGITSVYWLGGVLPRGVGTITLPVVLLAAATVVVLSFTWVPLRRLLSASFFQWAGRISFSLYLTHELIVVSTAQVLPLSFTWVTPIVSIPLSLAFAMLFFRLVESPAHRLSKRVAAALNKKSRRSGASEAGRP